MFLACVNPVLRCLQAHVHQLGQGSDFPEAAKPLNGHLLSPHDFSVNLTHHPCYCGVVHSRTQ